MNSRLQHWNLVSFYFYFIYIFFNVISDYRLISFGKMVPLYWSLLSQRYDQNSSYYTYFWYFPSFADSQYCFYERNYYFPIYIFQLSYIYIYIYIYIYTSEQKYKTTLKNEEKLFTIFKLWKSHIYIFCSSKSFFCCLNFWDKACWFNLQASNNTGILNTCTRLWLTESEQATPWFQ